jgi:hypothetical protein
VDVKPLCQPSPARDEIAPPFVAGLAAAWRSCAAVAALAASLAGCAGAHIYDEAKDKMAQQAKTQYESADLLKVVTVERTNLAKDLETELVVVQRHIDTVLKAEWFRLSDSNEPLKVSYIAKGIGAREKELGIDTLSDDQRIEVANLDRTMAEGEDKLADVTETITIMLGQAPAGCTAPEATRAASLSSLRDLARQRDKVQTFETLNMRFEDVCLENLSAIETRLAPIRDQDHALLVTSYKAWKKARDDQRQLEEAFGKARAEYEKAAADYMKAVAEKAAAGAAVSERTDLFQAHVEQLRTLLKAVADAGGALGLQFVGETRAQEIDTLLTAAAGGVVDPSHLKTPEVTQAAAVAATSPSLAEAAYALVNSGRTPLVAALLIEKQHQQVMAAAAGRRVERIQSRVDLLQQQFYAVVQEARQYREIELAHARGKLPASGLLDQTAVQALKSANGPAKAALWLSLMHYVDSIHTYRAREEKLDYMLIALDHDEAVDNSEMAVGLWNSLIATPVNQIAAYHSAGIRAEDLAALVIQALSLGGIAVGVNR